jgi:type I restriction enzyme M protein
MAKKTTTDEQSLELIMRNYRNALRETTGGNEKNCNAAMDLVFLKFGGDRFDKRRKEGFLK